MNRAGSAVIICLMVEQKMDGKVKVMKIMDINEE